MESKGSTSIVTNMMFLRWHFRQAFHNASICFLALKQPPPPQKKKKKQQQQQQQLDSRDGASRLVPRYQL